MSSATHLREERDARSGDDRILRFRRSERHLHWAIAVPFMVCYVTAAILVGVYNQNPARPFREVFSWIHRISGLCLLTLPPLTLAIHWRDLRLHLQNIKHAWVWSRDDVKWLLLAGPAALSSRVAQPDQGKFNAGEKVNFMVLMVTYPVYLVTGLAIWRLEVPYLSWIVHLYMAVFLATPLVAGHIFLATVNPDTRVGLSGMLSGFVDRRWARHHYRSWYEEQVRSAEALLPATHETEAATSGGTGGPSLDQPPPVPALCRKSEVRFVPACDDATD
jgi:formate dehydrogenase subunit gamma